MLIKLIFSLFLICTSVAKAELKYLVQISEDLKQADRPFAASYYLKKYLQEDSGKKFHTNYEHLLGLIDLVGYGVFDDLSLFDTRRYPFAAMYYHSLKSLVFNKQFEKTIKVFQGFPDVYKNHPAFLQLAGFAAYQLNQNTLSLKLFTKCNQKIKGTTSPHFMSSRNFFLIAQQCQAYLAREYYRQGQYRQALKIYNKIDEKSYYYPNTFTEKAWSHYQLKDYNRVLGLNLAFHATWLSPFYTGEIDLLGALSLIKLCRWDDVFYFLGQLHFRSNKAIANTNKIDFFLEKHLKNYLDNRQKFDETLPPELRRILNRFRLNSHWEKIYSDYKVIQEELSVPKSQIIDSIDRIKLNAFIGQRQKEIYAKIKKYFYDEIRNYRFELYQNKAEADALELEVYARYRNTLYKNENGLDSLTDKQEEVLNSKEVQPQRKWRYEKEKWRDEIGRYNVNIPSMCKLDKEEISL